MQLSPRGHSHPHCLARSNPCGHRRPHPSARPEPCIRLLLLGPRRLQGSSSCDCRLRARKNLADRADGDKLGLRRTRGGRCHGWKQREERLEPAAGGASGEDARAAQGRQAAGRDASRGERALRCAARPWPLLSWREFTVRHKKKIAVPSEPPENLDVTAITFFTLYTVVDRLGSDSCRYKKSKIFLSH